MSPSATADQSSHFQNLYQCYIVGSALVCVSGGVGVVSNPDPVISLGVCVQGVGTRVARVGGRCAVVWLASEWHRVVCAVSVACGTQSAPPLRV